MTRSLSAFCLALVAACRSTTPNDPGASASSTPTEPGTPGSPASTPVAPPPADAAPPTTSFDAPVRAFDDALATAICTRLAACCSDADYALFFARFHDKPYNLSTTPTPPQCATVLGQTLWTLHSKWAASASRGRIAFDAARGQSCVASMSAAACGVPLSVALNDDRCLGLRGNEVFRKTTPIGSACQDIGDGTFYGECDPALGFCGSSFTCEPWAKTGEPCQLVPTRKFCAADLACDGATPSAPGSCSPPPVTKKLGEGCGANTGPLELCETGTYCDYVAMTCLPLKADGASCAADDECASAHPYTCTPAGAGTCGTNSFCSGGSQ
jgi:hypothetical protein